MTAKLEVLHVPPADPVAGRPPLLFLHGAFCGAWIWVEHFLPWFAARGWDCWAPSLRGHGASPLNGSIDYCGVEDYVADALSVLDGLESQPVAIGHSMGGMVAQRCLARRRLPGAALLASAPPHGLLESTLGLAWRDPFVFHQMSILTGFGREHVDPRGLHRALFSPRVSMDELRRLEPLFCEESRRILMEMNLWNPLPPRPIGAPPILVLGAEQDMLFPPDQVRATARFYGVEPEFFPEMGHTMMLEPDWLNVAMRLEAWLAGICKGEAPARRQGRHHRLHHRAAENSPSPRAFR